MPQLRHFNIQEFREEICGHPNFAIAFRNLELSKKPNTLVALLQDGTYLEYTFTPGTYGMRVQTKKIARDEAMEQYKPSFS